MKKITVITGSILVLLVLLLAGYWYYTNSSVNPGVVAELRNNPNGDRAQRSMVLSLPDGRDIPVNYLREGAQVFVGADGPWWRQFRDGDVPVRMFISGETLEGRARTILDDPEYTRDVFKRLRPNVPKWLPDWLNAYLIVIDLDEQLDT